MTRQNRPPRRVARQVHTQASVGGPTVTVAGSAVSSLRRFGLGDELAELSRAPTVKELRDILGDDEIRRIAHRHKVAPPSSSTIRRWARQNRIPHSDLAQILERHRIVSVIGGVAQTATLLGRSESAIRRWKSGRQHRFRGEAQDAIDEARVRERMMHAGVMTPDGRLKTVTVSFWAHVQIRVPGDEGYSYNAHRQFNFVPSAGTGLSEEATWTLAAAVATGQHDMIVAILEDHASRNYAAFDDYDNEEGFHIDAFDGQPTVTWE